MQFIIPSYLIRLSKFIFILPWQIIQIYQSFIFTIEAVKTMIEVAPFISVKALIAGKIVPVNNCLNPFCPDYKPIKKGLRFIAIASFCISFFAIKNGIHFFKKCPVPAPTVAFIKQPCKI